MGRPKFKLAECKLSLGCRAQPSRNETRAARLKGLYICQCWCGRNYVWINKKDLMEGYTYGCGRPKCNWTHRCKTRLRK